MRVTQHLPDKQIQFDYSFHQQNLEQVQSAKYLTEFLDRGQYISEISCKATTTGFSSGQFGLGTNEHKGSCIQNIGSPSA